MHIEDMNLNEIAGHLNKTYQTVLLGVNDTQVSETVQCVRRGEPRERLIVLDELRFGIVEAGWGSASAVKP